MNARTRESLGVLRDYWQEHGSEPFKEDVLAQITAALEAGFPLSDDRLKVYLERLSGPEGCDFKPDDTWRCAGGTDKSLSEAILRGMGLGDEQVEAVHRVVDALGGHCDCEILFNAAERMLP